MLLINTHVDLVEKWNQERILRELGDNLSLSTTQQKRKTQEKGHSMSHDLKIFDFQTIVAATNNFSLINKIGEGGFGPVYKVIKIFATIIDIQGLIYQLNWQKRYNIIEGIAQGLIYLHKYSRLRVIHRDLKASNILLDDQMNPKISDFGLARIFRVNELEVNTNRVVGTYGYMSPEYAMSGIVSMKIDVFSFGVLVLEIVSGKKNNSCYHSERPLNLIGYDQPTDRPTMSDVVSMLTNETMILPAPKQPAFFVDVNPDEEVVDVLNNASKHCSVDSTDKLLPGQLLKDGDELVSAFGNFRMGFFSYESLEDRYLGIWYYRPTDPSDSHWPYGSPKINQPVWVANRNTPITDKSGSLTIDSRDVNLKILRKGGNSIVVSSVQAMGNTSAA
ncbi:hypothetical protein CUMW_235860 [Citrus unshiu]|uniref:non-specific serine/threonine protein kinase n=1 Tax=Citrus unshiu TaxID=55188 RepID=A0A2H5QJG1_CITUN|nr:hypothetical protein CUMW_235860 [Citrus unshiu]